MATTAGGQASKRGGIAGVALYKLIIQCTRSLRLTFELKGIIKDSLLSIARFDCHVTHFFPTYLRVLPPAPPHFPPFGSLVLQFSSSTINANRFHLQTLFVQHFRESFNKLCAWHFPGNFSATTNVPSCCSCCCCPCWLCCCNRCSLLALAC